MFGCTTPDPDPEADWLALLLFDDAAAAADETDELPAPPVVATDELLAVDLRNSLLRAILQSLWGINENKHQPNVEEAADDEFMLLLFVTDAPAFDTELTVLLTTLDDTFEPLQRNGVFIKIELENQYCHNSQKYSAVDCLNCWIPEGGTP